MIDDQIGFQLGQVMVSTTHNKGHDVEFWAAQTTKKIVGISEEADPHIRLQAEAFRNQVYTLILLGMKSAIASDLPLQSRLVLNKSCWSAHIILQLPAATLSSWPCIPQVRP